MTNPASGTNIPALSTTPDVLVSGAGNPAITSVLTMVDASAGGGVTLPKRSEAWSFVVTNPKPGCSLDGRGLTAADIIRLISLGPADVTIVPYAGDDAPVITTLKAFTCIDILPSGACIRIW
ncbi:MAG: hypothetical protein ACLP4V_23980 [Methylocella sp.]